ncbi:MAG: phage integrase SAM-like domain-containing protein [Chitinophagaceae bacterium]|nr:phage integrase SAM-like domain-containing protein [Chitinophagaceae bacterium]
MDKNWLEDFKTYLISEAKSKTNKNLSQNSQSSYFNKVTAALKKR